MKRILLLLSLLFMLTGCKNDFGHFEDMAAAFAKSDGSINAKELNSLKDEIKLFADDRDFKRFYTNGNVDEAKVVKYLKAKEYKVLLAPEVDHAKDTINVYIENSESMLGYVNGQTEFKTALTQLLVKLNDIYGNRIKINFINKDVSAVLVEGKIFDYTDNLNKNTLSHGLTKGSNLHEIYSKVLDRTSNNTISILLSDCIYSIPNGDTADLLKSEKAKTTSIFKQKVKDDLATSIIKLTSKFDGNYFNKYDHKDLINEARPYYITLLGSSASINFLFKKTDFHDLEGYQNNYLMTPKNYIEGIYYTVVNTNTSSGFRPIRELSDASSVKGIEDVEVNERNGGKFTFSIAVDMHDFPVEEEVITDVSNYSITDEYTIAVSKYSGKTLKPNSVQQIAKSGSAPTHLITVTAKTAKYPDVKFALKKQIPKWVYNTSTNDDTIIKDLGSKTFGFKYLVEGINDASQSKASSNNYFEINIKINN